MISVIVPAYNAQATLGRCLEALHAQTAPPHELIVVDDGSTDGTAEVARRYGVQVIRQENAGAAAARNAGARAAQGEILLFTDADCMPAPNWVARMAAPFADSGVSGVKGVYRSAQQELWARFVQIEYKERYERMRGQERIDFVDTYAAGYRREIFLQAGGFDTTFPGASVEDQEFSFRLAQAGHRMVFVDDALVFHLHDRSLGEYVRRKFWIGYWKMLVMRRHPSKLAQDSHTPQSLKLQLVLAALGGGLLAGGGATRRGRLTRWGAGAWLAFFMSTLPFVRRAWPQDRQVALLAPFMLFVRAWALGLGFLMGGLRWLVFDALE